MTQAGFVYSHWCIGYLIRTTIEMFDIVITKKKEKKKRKALQLTDDSPSYSQLYCCVVFQFS